MTSWSQIAEFLALTLIILLALYFYDPKQTRSRRRMLFSACLCLSALSILLDIASVMAIHHYELYPHWLNMLLNSAYFLVLIWTCSASALYIFNLLLEHVYEKHCKTRAIAGLLILNVIYLVIVIVNVKTGLLFRIDSDGMYRQGPFNKAGYAIMIIELCMVLICYMKNRSSISKNVLKVIRILFPVILILSAFQLAFPKILLNGAIFAFIDLVLFINYQSYQAERDSLTHIGNRKSFYHELTLRIAGDQQFQVISISLKHFVVVNQRFGYQKGDEFLYSIASWLDRLDLQSRAFRFGNVSFAVISPFVSQEEADARLEAIQRQFQKGWTLGEIHFDIMACFSEIIRLEESWAPDRMIEYLEFMNTMAKRDDIPVIRFNKDIEQQIERKTELTELLKNAIQNDRFQVWYQPVMDCTSGAFSYAEALLRLKDCKGMAVSPNEFIPLAEETGLIDDISWIVLEKVCHFLGAHPALPLKAVSINLSMQQFLDPHITSRLETCLNRCQVPMKKLKIEITERVIAYDLPYINSVMNQITQKGIGFYLDDFGIGYSNFSSIMHLPFECVKLDRSLFDKLLKNEKDQTIVRTMIDLAHSVGFQVVSEGIETKDQADLLKKLGTDRIQGYYYAHPMDENELLEFYKRAEHLTT